MRRNVVLIVGFLVWSSQALASLPDFASIVEDTSPAVVKIIAEVKPVQPEASERFEDLEQLEQIPDYLRRFFQYRNPPMPRGGGTGSGFFISSDGYVVTNHHVVDGADVVIVRLSDRREFDATVIGSDERSDLALLKVDGDNFPSLKLGSSQELRVGEWVLAIGSPFGLDYSVTAGIVSAKGRSLPTDRGENYVPFLQTDVAINPGNSGGPLFNLDGEVVGVNSQIFTRSGGSIGLSFSIPSLVVENVIGQLMERGSVVRGWLGVTIQNVDRTLAESFGLDRPRGALVAQVGDDSPAEAAGIEPGDIIVNVDGSDIEVSADLPHVVGLIAPDTKVNMVVIRDGEPTRLRVRIGSLGADEPMRLSTVAPEPGKLETLGMTIEAADEAVLDRAGLRGGVLVTDVENNSVAAEAGIAPGDVITMFGRSAISSLSDMEDVLETVEPGDSVRLRVSRQGNFSFLGLVIPDDQ